MGLTRKETRWKRNRKFGDVYGGRESPKLAENIFRRCHSIQRPSKDEVLPILMEDNPSRDFFHPLSAEEAKDALQQLPEFDAESVTHIWCRRLSHQEWEDSEQPWAEFICGNGVHVIVLYAWPKDRIISWKKKPSNRTRNTFSRCGVQVTKKDKKWQAKPTTDQLRRFYLQELLFDRVGSHVDWFNRHWSKANGKASKDFSTMYAVQFTNLASNIVDNMKVADEVR